MRISTKLELTLCRVSLLSLTDFIGQRPLQAVRLLQREREERETDEKFNS
jgi:hypothetical protein